jgi:hypothetical protein
MDLIAGIAELRKAGVQDAQIAFATGYAVRSLQTWASRSRVAVPAVSPSQFMRRLAEAHAQFVDVTLGLRERLDPENAILLVFVQPDVTLIRSAGKVMIQSGYVRADQLEPLLTLLDRAETAPKLAA